MRYLTPAELQAQIRTDAQTAAVSSSPPGVRKPTVKTDPGILPSGVRLLTNPDEITQAEARISLTKTPSNWMDTYKAEFAISGQQGRFGEDTGFLRHLLHGARGLVADLAKDSPQEVGESFIAGLGSVLTKTAAFGAAMMDLSATTGTGNPILQGMAPLEKKMAPIIRDAAMAGTKRFENMVSEDPGLSSKLAFGAGQMTAYILPAALTGGFSSLLEVSTAVGTEAASAGAVGALMNTLATPLGQATTSATFMAMAEAGEVMEQSLARGDSQDQATINGAKVVLPVMAEGIAMHYVRFSGWGRLARAGGTGIANGLFMMDLGQLEDWALGQGSLKPSVEEYLSHHWQDGALGFVIGAVTGLLPEGHTGKNRSRKGARADMTRGKILGEDGAPSRQGPGKAPRESDLGEFHRGLRDYADRARLEARDLSVQDLSDITDRFSSRVLNGERLTLTESVQWMAAQDELWKRQISQHLQQYSDQKLVDIVKRTLDQTTPDAMGADAQALLLAARADLEQRGLLTDDIQAMFHSWARKTNPRGLQMKALAAGEPEGKVEVSIEPVFEGLPEAGFNVTVTQPDGSSETMKFPTLKDAEQFKQDRERIGVVKPGKTSAKRGTRGEVAPSEENGTSFYINTVPDARDNPYAPIEGYTVKVIDPDGGHQEYHFETKEQANAFAHKKADALTKIVRTRLALEKMTRDLQDNVFENPDDLLDLVNEQASTGESLKNAVKPLLQFLANNQNAVAKKFLELRGIDPDQPIGGIIFASPEHGRLDREKAAELKFKAEVEVIRDNFGDIRAADYEKYREQIEEAKKLRKEADAEKAKAEQKKEDQKTVDKLVQKSGENYEKDAKQAAKDEVQNLVSEQEAEAKKKAEVERAIQRSAKEADRRLGTGEILSKDVRALLKENELKFTDFKRKGPGVKRRLKGRTRPNVYDEGQVKDWIAKQLEEKKTKESAQQELKPEEKTPEGKTTGEDDRPELQGSTDYEIKKFGLRSLNDSFLFEAKTVAQKKYVSEIEAVAPALADKIRNKEPISRRALEGVVRELDTKAEQLMDAWMRYTKKYGFPKANLGGPMLTPPEVDAIERAIREIQKQLANLDAGRPAWDNGPRGIPRLPEFPLSEHRREFSVADKALAEKIDDMAKHPRDKEGNVRVLTPEEAKRAVEILKPMVEQAFYDFSGALKKDRKYAWRMWTGLKHLVHLIKQQQTNLKINERRLKRLAKEQKKQGPGRGDMTLGVGFGGLQPLYDALEGSVKKILRRAINRRPRFPWSRGMRNLTEYYKEPYNNDGPGWIYRMLHGGFTQRWVDDLYDFKTAVEAGTEGLYKRGLDLGSTENLLALNLSPYHIIRGMVRSTSALADLMIEKGIGSFLDPGKQVAPALEKVLGRFQSVTDNYDEFGTYLRSRMIKIWAEDHPEDFGLTGKTPRNPEQAQRWEKAQGALAQAARVVDEAHAAFPEWAEVARDLTKISRGVLQYLKDSGLYSEADIQRIVGTHDMFVPMWTAADKVSTRGATRRQFTPKPVKTFTRYEPGAQTIHPAEALGLNIHQSLSAAHNNYARIKLYDLLEMGAGFGEIVDPKASRRSIFVPKQNLYALARGEIVTRMKALLAEENVDKNLRRKILKELQVNKISDSYAKLWITDMKLSNDIVPLLKDGEVKFIRVAPAIAEAFEVLGKQRADWLVKIASTFTGLKRTGITLTPEFSTRNPMRDVMTSLVVLHKQIKNPVGVARYMLEWWASMAQVAGKAKEFQEMIYSGGGISGFHAMDLPELATRTQELLDKGTKQGKIAFVVKHPIEALRIIASLSEDATRLNNYKFMMDYLDKSPFQYSDEAKKLIAGMAAREGSVDFQKAGEYGRVMNHFSAFFNAEIGGGSVMVDAARRDPKGFVGWGMATIGLATAALYLANHRDKETAARYDAEPQWVKYNYFVFYPTKHTKIMIPKPHEAGAIFGSGTEYLLDAIYKKDPAVLWDWFKGFVTQTIPGRPLTLISRTHVFGSLGESLGDLSANYDPFRQAPIVSDNLTKMRPAEQYRESTSALAKWLAHRLDRLASKVGTVGPVSPIKLDYLIRSNLGNGPREIHDAALFAYKKLTGQKDEVAPEKWYYRAPVLKAFVRKDPGTYDAYMEKFFELYSAAEGAAMSYRRAVDSGDWNRVADEMDTVGDLLGVYGILSSTANDFFEMSRHIETVKHLKNWTPERKRDEIDRIREMRAREVRMQLESLDMRALRKQADEFAKKLRKMNQKGVR